MALQAILDALNRGGIYSILFIFTLKNGRIDQQDKFSMKLVLDAVPAIGRNYGIVVNQVYQDWLGELKGSDDNFNRFTTHLLGGLDYDRRTSCITFILRTEKLLQKIDTWIPMEKLKKFVDDEVPKCCLTPGKLSTKDTINRKASDLDLYGQNDKVTDRTVTQQLTEGRNEELAQKMVMLQQKVETYLGEENIKADEINKKQLLLYNSGIIL